MKILTVADTPADPDRGAAGTEVQTVRALRAIGHDVDSIWSDTLGRRIAHGNLHLLLELPRAYESAVVDALKRTHYDVVHINQPHGFRAARAVHRLSPGTICVHRSHGFELNVEETLAPWLERFHGDERALMRRTMSRVLAALLARHSYAIARDADGHIVSSTLDRDYLIDRLRVPRERVAVIPHAPPDPYVETAAPPMTVERLHRVLYVGQFAFVKAPMIVAAAINQLCETTDIEPTWVCDVRHHGNVRALLSAEANKRIVLRHWMTQGELRDVYDRCGIFLFPSFFEGFGKAFLEAMSRGLCVVASSVGGMRDVIEDGRTGMLVPPGDADAVAAAARVVIDDSPRAFEMSRAAATAARAYTWERAARELAEFYGTLCEHTRR